MKDIIKVANTNNGVTNEELQSIIDEVINEAGRKPLKRFYCFLPTLHACIRVQVKSLP